nr:RNA-dependent RNA polymerase [Picobirnavirus sp.]
MDRANLKNSQFGKTFNQYERTQLSKFGPQGAVPSMADSQCAEVILPLFLPSLYNSEFALSKYFNRAKAFASMAFGGLKTKRPIELQSVVDDMRVRDTLSTNSGYPLYARRNSVSSQSIQDAASGKAYEYPAIILFRQYNGKLRPVWMYPMAMNLLESSFSNVIQSALRDSPSEWIRSYVSPWEGYERVKETLTQQWKSPIQLDGGDTTKMDANMRPAQLRLFFEIVKWLFQEKYWTQLYQCVMQVNNIPLLVSTDQKLVGIHGLASGSAWTQISETVLQLFMAWNRGLTTGGQGIGDDFYWISNMNASELVNYLSNFGLPANPDKQTISNSELHFLQRVNIRGFHSRESSSILGGYYPTIRALNSMLNPEKFHKPKDWNKRMFAVRNFFILENCIDNPCFREFAQFVARGHSYLREFAEKSDVELNSIQRTARRVPGLNPSYNQEKLTKPLSSFYSIRFFRENL